MKKILIDACSWPLAMCAVVVVPSRWLAAFIRWTKSPAALQSLAKVQESGMDLDSWLPPAFAYRQRSSSDRQALNAIAEVLSGKEWSPATLDEIRDIVLSTKRQVAEPFNDRPPAKLDEVCACGEPMGRHRSMDLACPTDLGFAPMSRFTAR